MKEHSAILPHYSFDTPILQLARDCSLSIRQAFEGVQIFGGTGSGKTSGAGRILAHGFLQLGFGGLVLCAKPDEANNWRRYAAETGREDSFLFINGSPGQGFNFLEYEMKAYQHEGNQVNNAVETFMQIMKAANHSENRQDNNPFGIIRTGFIASLPHSPAYGLWWRFVGSSVPHGHHGPHR